jgi:N-acetylmuramoyl-L-alanine amidase
MKPKYIVLHHSAGPITQTAEAINEYHKRKWNFKSSLGGYAGYQYIIEKNGRATQWRADNEMGAHTIGRNHDSIGICVVGWFDKGHDKLPTEKQQEALSELLNKKMTEYSIPKKNILFHRDVQGVTKSCPGYNITKEFIYNLLDMKNYYITSELRDELKKIWDDFDHDDKESQIKMAEKLDEHQDAHDKQIDKLVDQYRKLIKDQDNLNKAHDLELTRQKNALTTEFNAKLKDLQEELEVCNRLKEGALEMSEDDYIKNLQEEIVQLKTEINKLDLKIAEYKKSEGIIRGALRIISNWIKKWTK